MRCAISKLRTRNWQISDVDLTLTLTSTPTLTLTLSPTLTVTGNRRQTSRNALLQMCLKHRGGVHTSQWPPIAWRSVHVTQTWRRNSLENFNPLKPSVIIRSHFQCSVPYRPNLPFLISDIRALWRSVVSARVPECQKLKWQVGPVWQSVII